MRRACWVIFGVLVLVSIGLLLLSQHRTPKYAGKSLDDWLEDLDDGQASVAISIVGSTSPRSDKQIKALEAIEAIGEEAGPLLLQMIQRDRSKFSKEFDLIVDRVRGVGSGLRTTDVEIGRWRAAVALNHLASKDIRIRKELVRLFNTTNHFAAKEIAFALGNAGPEGLTALTNCISAGLTNMTVSRWLVGCALWSIGHHPAAAKEALPLLIEAAGATNANVQMFALYALGQPELDSEQVLPVLINSLNTSNEHVFTSAIGALNKFGPAAKSAIPLIREQTNNPARAMQIHWLIDRIEAAE